MRGRGSVFLMLLAGLLAIGVTFLASVAGAHNVRYGNRVTIVTDPAFHGRVISSRPGCTKKRLVRIYRVDPGTDGLFTSTRTGSDGRWRYLSPSLTGDFYARIAVRVARSAGHRHVCGSAASRPVRVQP